MTKVKEHDAAGIDTAGGSPEDVTKFISDEMAKWVPVVKNIGRQDGLTVACGTRCCGRHGRSF